MVDQEARVGPQSMQVKVLLLLEEACGSREAADAMVRNALVGAGLRAVPEARDDAVVFAHAHLLGLLGDRIGLGPALAFADDLAEQAEGPDSGVVPPPSSAETAAGPFSPPLGQPPSLLIVDEDSFRRAELARVLVQARWNVRTAHAVEQLHDAACGEERPSVVIVDLDHTSLEAVVNAVLNEVPEAAIILRGDMARTPASLQGSPQVRVCARDTPMIELIDALMGLSPL